MKIETSDPSAPPLDTTALTVLQNTRRGEILDELSAAIRKVSGAVELTRLPGKVTLTLNVLPSQMPGVDFLDDIAVKIPKAKKYASHFYVDDEGNLFRTDPKQQEMNLRSHDGGAASETNQPLRKVEAN